MDGDTGGDAATAAASDGVKQTYGGSSSSWENKLMSANKRTKIFNSITLRPDKIWPLDDESIYKWFEDLAAQTESLDSCPRFNEDGAHTVTTEEEADDSCEDNADSCAGTVGEDEIGLSVKKENTVVETLEGGEWGGQ